MSSKGLVWSSRNYIGSVSPPALMEDESRDRNDLAFANTAAWVRNSKGLWVLALDGNSDYASKSIADFGKGDYQGTIACWFKVTTSSGYKVLISSASEAVDNKSCQFRTDTSNGFLAIAFQIPANAHWVEGTTDVRDGVWHLGVCSTNGVNAGAEANHATDGYKIYLDAVRETCTVAFGDNSGRWFAEVADRDNLVVGAVIRTGIANYFYGQLAPVGIWNYPLSAEVIAAIYQKEKHWFNK